MEDRLEEAIHVLRSHAVGQGPGLEGAHSDMHSLLSSVHNGGLGGLSPAFPNASLALSNRHPAMVSHLLCSTCFLLFLREVWARDAAFKHKADKSHRLSIGAVYVFIHRDSNWVRS